MKQYGYKVKGFSVEKGTRKGVKINHFSTQQMKNYR